MEVKIRIYILFFLLFCIACDLQIEEPYFPPPIENIAEISAEIIDAFHIGIKWEYDLLLEDLEYFKLYVYESENQIDEITSFTFLNDINLNEIDLDQYDGYNYYIIDNLDQNKWYYFSISAFIKGYESIDNPITNGVEFTLESPQIIEILNSCSNYSFDDDCIIVNIYPNTESLSNEISLVERIYSNADDIDTTIYYSNIFQINTIVNGLSLCDNENLGFFNKDYCFLKPNTPYYFEYYYEQVSNDIVRHSKKSKPYEEEVFFNRSYSINNIKTLSSTSIRLYLDKSIIQDNFFTTLRIMNNNNFEIINDLNIELYNNKIIDNYIITDIDDVNNIDIVNVLAIGDNSYFYFNDSIDVVTLPIALQGFQLIEKDLTILNQEDIYFSKFELTDESNYIYGNLPTFDQLPLEINYCQSIEVINNLNEYWSGQYLFRMPNIDEWEFVCNRDIFNDNFSVFPWGDSEESYCANYINSFCPLDTGLDENGLCSVGFHEYTFPAYCSNIQGIYDLSGNVNEWIFSGVDNSCNGTATSKGGSYYDQPSSIECSYDGFLNVPMDKIDGMGLRLVMEIINNE